MAKIKVTDISFIKFNFHIAGASYSAYIPHTLRDKHLYQPAYCGLSKKDRELSNSFKTFEQRTNFKIL
jgi:hypothetical protein